MRANIKAVGSTLYALGRWNVQPPVLRKDSRPQPHLLLHNPDTPHLLPLLRVCPLLLPASRPTIYLSNRHPHLCLFSAPQAGRPVRFRAPLHCLVEQFCLFVCYAAGCYGYRYSPPSGTHRLTRRLTVGSSGFALFAYGYSEKPPSWTDVAIPIANPSWADIAVQ